MGTCIAPDVGVLRGHPEPIQVPVNTSYPAGIRDIDCGLQAGTGISITGQYGSERYGSVLDGRRSELMRVSSPDGGSVLGLTDERGVRPGGHCM